MPHYCILPRCGHSMSSSSCRFYVFPKQPEILKKWKQLLRITATEMKNLKPYSRVCSCHFIDHDKKNLPTIYNLNGLQRRFMFDDSLISQKRNKRKSISTLDETNDNKQKRLDDQNAGMSGILVNSTAANELVDDVVHQCLLPVQDSHKQEISILKTENALFRQQ